jgi:prefoldin subunit 5
MAKIPPHTVDWQRTVLLENREALIPTLKEFQRRIEHLATYLEDLEQESLALRSAAENIEYVIERLQSLKAATLS